MNIEQLNTSVAMCTWICYRKYVGLMQRSVCNCKWNEECTIMSILCIYKEAENFDIHIYLLQFDTKHIFVNPLTKY